MFSPKGIRVGGPPPNGSAPPQRKILDPPLELNTFSPILLNLKLNLDLAGWSQKYVNIWRGQLLED